MSSVFIVSFDLCWILALVVVAVAAAVLLLLLLLLLLFCARVGGEYVAWLS